MTTDNHDPFALARCGADDAELFALIEEYRRLDRQVDELYAEADSGRTELALPPVRVEIGKVILSDGSFDPVYAETEKQITADRFERWGLGLRQALRANPPGTGVEIDDDRVDEQLAEFRAQVATNDERCRAAGIDALIEQGDQIYGTASDILGRIQEYRPTTLRGVVAVFDFQEELDLDWFPDAAAGCLREIVEWEAQS
jgi:hypothetical protein